MDSQLYAKIKKCISIDINAGHSFTTTTDRDTFFTANPTQLKANMYIYCNGQLQQYINSAWEVRSTAIQGSKGDTGITPHIDSTTNNWFIDTVDTGILAIGANGNDGVTPHIDNTSKHWFIDTIDTGILAEGTDGLTPHIDETTNNWFIGTTDTGIKAVGTNGITPHIGLNGNWYVGETDTLVKAQGVNGTDGVSIQSVVDNGDNTFTITLADDTTVIIDKIDTINSDVITQGTTKLLMTTAERTKLTSVESGAEVNNISDTNATDLTDNGDTTLHYHSSDRDRTNHTGVQAISTVTGLQTALDSKTNKDFTTYTQKADVANDDKISINDSADSNSIKYVTLNQLISSVQDPHNKGYYTTGTALNTAIPTATNGDFAVVGATNTIWVWNGTTFVDSSANGAVLSINGRTGVITLTKADVGLNNVVNLDTSTTVNITDSTDKRFVTDANLVVIGNTSGTNTGDETNATIKTKLGTDLTNKVDKVEGKSLVLDTDIVKLTNLDGTNTGDETTSTIKTKLGNVSITTDGYLTSNQYNSLLAVATGDMTKAIYDTNNNGIVDNAEKVNGFTVAKNVPSDALFTDTTYTAGTNVEITAEHVINVTGGGNITIDSALSDTSENPVQNKIVKTALDSKVNSVVNMGLSSNDFTNTLKTKLDGIAESANNYTLPTASTTVKGGIKVDGTSITVDENGVASASGSASGGDGLTEEYIYAICNDGIKTLGSKSTTISWYMNRAYIPSSITSIGSYWFYNAPIVTISGCSGLSAVGIYFASGCTALTSLSCPKLMSIDAYFAYNCPLTHLEIELSGVYIESKTGNDYSAWKLPVADMVAFGNAITVPTLLPTTLTFGATYWNALSAEQKAIFTNKKYTIATV